MSKRQSKINKIKAKIENAIIEIEGTVVRDYKGNVLYYTDKAILTYNKGYDVLEAFGDDDLLETEYKKELISRIKVIEENLPYLQGGN